MRRPIVAGNWKMHGTRSQAYLLLDAIRQQHQALSTLDIVVFPPFVHLQQAEELLVETSISWGAQNLYVGNAGAFTGEISGAMLVDYGCQYVLVGHSERRTVFHEDLSLVAAKFKAALEVKLKPVLCIGETQQQRAAGETENILQLQLDSVIAAVGIEVFRRAVIAYEPVWAIGTGVTATPEEAQAAHAFIRRYLARQDKKIAEHICLLYGGSVKADNAAGIFAMPDIDGGLIGGASLTADSFLAICQAASVEKTQIEG